MDKIPQIFVEKKVIDTIHANSRKFQNVETGGLLMGYKSDYKTCRSIFITTSSGPGKNALHTPHSFQPDLQHYEKVLSKNTQLDYLGEWHTHPKGAEIWSPYDHEQALKILLEENREEMLCVIFLPGKTKTQGVLKFFYMHRELPNFLPLSYTIIPTIKKKKTKPKEIYIDESYLLSILRNSDKASLSGDYYEEDEVIHLFAQPNKNNIQILMCHKKNPHVHLNNKSQVILIVDDSEKKLTARCYYFHKNQFYELNTQIICTKRDQFTRNNTLLETTVLRKSHVVMVGVGSVGSVAALEMTRAGIGKLTLIDPDTVAISNLSRHICDLSELGIAKVQAVKRRIKKILPKTKVFTHVVDTNIDPDKTLELCRGANAIFVSTDTENSRLLMNWIAHELNIPIIFAGVLERATGGRVWRIVPNKTSCYECHSKQLDVHPQKKVAYSNANNLQDIEVQPGLGNDIAFISHLGVRYVIETLKEPQAKHLKSIQQNAVFWFNYGSQKWQTESLTIFHVKDIAKNLNCQICGDNNASH